MAGLAGLAAWLVGTWLGPQTSDIAGIYKEELVEGLEMALKQTTPGQLDWKLL